MIAKPKLIFILHIYSLMAFDHKLSDRVMFERYSQRGCYNQLAEQLPFNLFSFELLLCFQDIYIFCQTM